MSSFKPILNDCQAWESRCEEIRREVAQLRVNLPQIPFTSDADIPNKLRDIHQQLGEIRGVFQRAVKTLRDSP